MKNQKICIICGKAFFCPPSDKTVTCSLECRSKYASIRGSKRVWKSETKSKMSIAAQGRDMSELQVIGAEAARKSPKSGPFETNINSNDWRLTSPDGKVYRCRNLNFWVRSHVDLFGLEPTKQNFIRIQKGLRQAKRGKQASTYKGWRVELDDKNQEEYKEV